MLLPMFEQKSRTRHRVPACSPVSRRQTRSHGQVPRRTQRSQQTDGWRIPWWSSNTVSCTGSQVLYLSRRFWCYRSTSCRKWRQAHLAQHTRRAPDCRVLPPGMIPEPLHVYSDSFMTIAVTVFAMKKDKKLSCCRETARRFVSHSRSFEMTPFSTACVSPN